MTDIIKETYGSTAVWEFSTLYGGNKANTVLAEKLINKYILKMQLLASLSFTPGVQAVDHVSTEK